MGDDRHGLASNAAREVGLGHLQQVLALETNLPGSQASWRLGDDPHNGAGDGGLATAAFPHHAENFSFSDTQPQVVNGLHHTLIGVEIDDEIVDL